MGWTVDHQISCRKTVPRMKVSQLQAKMGMNLSILHVGEISCIEGLSALRC
jgi:hypothetical protein